MLNRLGEPREADVVRIAFAIHNYFPHSGLARDLRKIANECVRRGHRVRVYALRWQGECLEGVDTVLLAVTGVRGHVRQRRFADAVTRHWRGDPVDLLVGMHKMPGLDVYYAGDVCFVAKARGQRPRAYRWTPRYRHFAAFEQSVFGAAADTDVLTISPRQTDLYRAVYGTPTQRLHALPPGLERWREQHPASRDAVRAELGAGAAEALLLFVGSGFVTKGLDRGLRALAALPEELRARTCLRVVGVGRTGAFERLARRLGVASRVRFLGGRDDVPALLGAADGLVLPSRNEATGTVILEAAVAGVPVLATANCGYASCIASANAGIVTPEPFDQQRLNADLERLLVSEERAAWARHGRELGRDECLYAMPKEAVDLLERLARQRRAPSRSFARAEVEKAGDFGGRASAAFSDIHPREREMANGPRWADRSIVARGRPRLYLRDDFQADLRSVADVDDADVFAALETLVGEVYRLARGRRTLRIAVAGKPYFAKFHDGVGVAEIIKNLVSCKVPVLGARNEFEACRRLRRHGVAAPRVAAFAERGRNPARRRSLVVCDAVEGCRSLEELAGCAKLSRALRRRLISAAGTLLGAVHAAGVYHRDCYAGHLLFHPTSGATGSVELTIIDLHRARVRVPLPKRWRQRDLAALLFSATAWQLTPRERVRFAIAYAGKRKTWRHDSGFWRGVARRAAKLGQRNARRGHATAEDSATARHEQMPSVADFHTLRHQPPTPFRFDIAFGGGAARVRCEAILRWRRGAQFATKALVNGEERLLAVFFGQGGGRRYRRARELAKRLAATGAGPELLETGRSGPARVLMWQAAGRPAALGDAPLLAVALARLHAAGARPRDMARADFRVSEQRALLLADEVRPLRLRGRWSAERDLAALAARCGGALSIAEAVRRYTGTRQWPSGRLRERRIGKRMARCGARELDADRLAAV